MNDHGAQNQEPQVDEAVWNAWMKKNEAKDKISSARMKKALGLVVILAVIFLLFWRVTT